MKEKIPAINIPRMPSEAIITRNKLINDLLESPSLSGADFKKGLAMRSVLWEEDKIIIRKELDEEANRERIIIQQAKAEAARKIFEILEEAFRNADNRMGLFILSREWQSLKAKWLKEVNYDRI